MAATASSPICTSLPIVPISAMSDDECVLLLAHAVDQHDAEHLDEVAQLIARLAVAIE
jgi:hypothetical protein